MPALTPAVWKQMEQEFKVGISVTELSEKYQVSRVTIYHRIKKHGWTQDGGEAIIKRVHLLEAGLTPETLSSPAVVENALWAAAERRKTVGERHLQMVGVLRGMQAEALTIGKSGRAGAVDEAFNNSKLVKINSEIAQIHQIMERKALGMDRDDAKSIAEAGGKAAAAAAPIVPILPPELVAHAMAILTQTKGAPLDPTPVVATKNGAPGHDD